MLALLWAAARKDLALDPTISAGSARLLEGIRAKGGSRGSGGGGGGEATVLVSTFLAIVNEV